MYALFWWGNLWERDHLDDLVIYGIIILICNLGEWVGGMD